MTSAAAVRVSAGERAAYALFGGPSARRASGGAETSLLPRSLRGRRWRQRRERTPVFAVDHRGGEQAERLPRIWVTEPVYDGRAGAQGGRVFVGAYPAGPDEGGERAFELASRYAGEARSCDGARREADRRIACWQAAEILYLHAAARGHAGACLCLAELYEADRCAGAYWRGALEERAAHAASAHPADRAYAWLVRAVEQGSPRACVLLGDKLACEAAGACGDARAVALYLRAADVLAADDEVASELAGETALRLARCCAWGRGCELSFERALRWYEHAAAHLAEAFDAGSWGCKRSLVEARRGVARMRQELSGAY